MTEDERRRRLCLCLIVGLGIISLSLFVSQAQLIMAEGRATNSAADQSTVCADTPASVQGMRRIMNDHEPQQDDQRVCSIATADADGMCGA